MWLLILTTVWITSSDHNSAALTMTSTTVTHDNIISLQACKDMAAVHKASNTDYRINHPSFGTLSVNVKVTYSCTQTSNPGISQ
jgi:hypothetical protein